jgi:uncharacterized repeat protein (TIGR01451 family)
MLTAGPAAADTLPAFDFTSTYPNCVYSAAGIGYEWAHIFTTGSPPVEVTALNAPAGVTVPVPFSGFDGTDSVAVLAGSADVAPGVYTIQLEATNSAGSVIAPFTLVAENGVTSPTFLSSGTATATAGTAFSYQPSVASCPPVGGYTITGEDAATASWLSIDTHTGLLSGAPSAADAGPHTFTLNANLQGDGGSVSQTFTLTVNSPVTTTVPGAPTIGTATPGNGQATVDFTAPASDGGSPITGYTVTATDITNPSHGGQTATGTGSPIAVTGLTNGDRYTFTVKATNAVGLGPASAPSKAVTPEAPKPRADLTAALSRHPSATDGSTFTETVTVTNRGPSTALNVVTKVIIPGHLSVVSPDGGKQAGAVISWTDPSLGVGKSVSYPVAVRVAARAKGTVLIAATIISTTVDPNPFNNWAITAVKLG